MGSTASEISVNANVPCSSRMRLYFAGVDFPFPDETLGSLIQRIGQRHELSFNGFKKIFETIDCPDMDFCMTADQIEKFGRQCHIPSEKLALIRNSCCRFVTHPELRSLLLQRNNDGIDYRFCPHCWGKDHTPYLRLDWRFRDAIYCRTHGVPLETTCTSCSMPLATHRSILGGSSHPPPVSSLAICLYCRSDMRQMSKNIKYFDVQPSWRCIHFQNAIISAILNGHFQTEARGVKRSIDELPAYLRAIGRSVGEIVISPFGNLAPREAKYLTKVLDKAIRDSKWLASGENKTTTPSSLAFKRWLLETGRLNRKVQS
jgi:hypothetical protein